MFSSYVQIRESAIYQSTKLACICAVNGPYPPTELAVHLVDSRTVKLQWKEPPLHGSPIVAYSIHYHSTRSGELQKVVRNTSTVLGPLTPFTNYTFFVKAYSSRGYSDPSSSVSLFTGDDGTMTCQICQVLNIPCCTSIPIFHFPLCNDDFGKAFLSIKCGHLEMRDKNGHFWSPRLSWGGAKWLLN